MKRRCAWCITEQKSTRSSAWTSSRRSSSCGFYTDFHWTLAFSYFDRLIGVWEGELPAPDEDDQDQGDIINLSYVTID